jgi:hypothetical protein
MSDYQHPFETINLPSEGRFYPEDSPLRSGQVDIKYLTAKEEDILTSTNLIQKNLVFDRLLESIILTKHEDGRSVKVGDFLIGDIDAILIAARTLAYGGQYEARAACDVCQESNLVVINLSELEAKEIELKTKDDGTFDHKLNDNVTLTLKLLTRQDERAIQKELSAQTLGNLTRTEVTTRLRAIIVAVNEDTTSKTINEFSNNMLLGDSRNLRDFYGDVVPGIDFDFDFKCSDCGNESTGRLVLGPKFFWPDLQV